MRRCELTEEIKVTLEKWAKSSGFPYIEPDGAFIIADDQGNPIMACKPKQIVELYLWVDPNAAPLIKLHALRKLHDIMIPELKAQGISEVNAFLPPEIERKFGRRLMRTFGWVRNWISYCKVL